MDGRVSVDWPPILSHTKSSRLRSPDSTDYRSLEKVTIKLKSCTHIRMSTYMYILYLFTVFRSSQVVLPSWCGKQANSVLV